MHTVRNQTIKARKNYRCQGREQIAHYYDETEHGKAPECTAIQVGQEYQYQFNVESGEGFVWRSCLPCYQFICEHGLYEEY